MNFNEIIKRILSSIILFPLVVYLIVKGSYLFNLLIILCFFISSYEWLKMNKNFFYKILGIFFLIISFYSIFKLRIEFDNNYIYVLFVVLICVSTDIGGYLFGNFFKGPKLTKISPKKTYSGMIGSFLLPIILAYIFFNFFSNKILYNFTKEIIIFILLLSLISQIGDIIVSYFKRKSNIKDTGNIIPGHGGILDRIDGMLFVFPFSYLIFMYWSF
jgi:phosphatidate cytidylyltransferase